jgi:DNA integrity scanning protein DisA with diadenylate cyclase activity
VPPPAKSKASGGKPAKRPGARRARDEAAAPRPRTPPRRGTPGEPTAKTAPPADAAARRARARRAALLESAARVVRKLKSPALFVYRDSVEDLQELAVLKGKGVDLIVLVRDEKERAEVEKLATRALHVPDVGLTRMGRVKVAVLLSFSQRLLSPGEQFVFLSGAASGGLDTLIVMQVGEEYELLQTVDQPQITEHVKRVVFERVLELAVRLAKEGREGKPVGAVFVIGDTKNVLDYCDQNIINPFRGYADEEKNVLDERISETIREFASIDGAFIIKGNGTICSAGTHLRPNIPGKPLPQGLGSRHAAAAAITATTQSIAITISESTGTVRVWRRGEMITSIEKAVEPTPAEQGPLMPLAGPE